MEPGNAVGTWVAWNLIPAHYLAISTAVVTAHGGRLSVGVNPMPDGSFQEDELKRLGVGYHAANKCAPWLRHLKSVPNIGIIYDGASELALMRQPGPRLRVQQETAGLHHALLEAGTHFDVIDSAHLDCAGYSALVLGDAVCPEESLSKALRSYVEAGGLLVVTGETSLYDRLAGAAPISPGPIFWACALRASHRSRKPTTVGSARNCAAVRRIIRCCCAAPCMKWSAPPRGCWPS